MTAAPATPVQSIDFDAKDIAVNARLIEPNAITNNPATSIKLNPLSANDFIKSEIASKTSAVPPKIAIVLAAFP